jgi:hypothetical protein
LVRSRGTRNLAVVVVDAEAIVSNVILVSRKLKMRQRQRQRQRYHILLGIILFTPS